jgi:UDP-glucuronate 4-epimerase
MRVLVTGGAGFIGSHVCEHLLRSGHDVAILDDLNTFYSPEAKLGNVAQIRSAGPVEFTQGDICDEALVAGVMDSFHPEAVIHLAARAGVRPSLEQPLLYEHVNVRGTMVLLEAAYRRHVRKFVFASSSSVYGNADIVPFREDASTNLPISPYAATKLAGEKICYTYHHLYGLDVVCLRFFTVYGPRQRPDLAIRRFLEKIAAGEPIPVFGDGSSGRDYTYVDDIVGGIVAALERNIGYDIFNLGNSRPVTLSAMIETMEQVVGRKAVIETLPTQPGDVALTFADISKANRLLGYLPRTDFGAGVQLMAKWLLKARMASA